MNRFYKFLGRIGVKDHRSFRLLLRGVALVGGLLLAFVINILMELHLFLYALPCLVMGVGIAALEFMVADVWAERTFPFETERKLALMEERLGATIIANISNRLVQTIAELEACDQTRVSATVHIVGELPSASSFQIPSGLIQLTDYVGSDGGKKGRITHINQGVIGRCARTKQLETVDFANEAEYSELMVREFGFTAAEAEKHTKRGRSYLAYPLLKDNKLVGVLYFFSTEPQVFPLAARNLQLTDVAREIVNDLEIAQLA